MAKYHLKDNGEPGECSAKEGNCPFGKDAPHFSTPQDARTHYEAVQNLTASLTGVKAEKETPIKDRVESQGLEDANSAIHNSQLLYAMDTDTREECSVEDLQDYVGDYGYTSPVLSLTNTQEVFSKKGKLKSDSSTAMLAVIADEEDLAKELGAHLTEDEAKELLDKQYLARHHWVASNVRMTSYLELHPAEH